jgi:ATP-dependent Clp protease ATP-binding subunit ClpA
MLERFTTAARAVVTQAQEEARDLGHTAVGAEHLLLALTQPPRAEAKADIAYVALADAGLTHAHVRDRVIQIGGSPIKLLSDEDAAALATIGIDFDAVLERVEGTFGPGAFAPKPGHVRFSKDAKTVLHLALREAVRLKSGYIGTEHLLLGLLRQRIGIAGEILNEAERKPADMRANIEAAMRAAA